MNNRQVYYVNGSPMIRVYQQPNYIQPGFQTNYYAPPPSHFMPYRQQPIFQQPRQIESIDGLEVLQEYEPDIGDPNIIQALVIKGEVVQMGMQEKEVINQSQGILSTEGYASENCKIWKSLPKIIMTPFRLGQLDIQRVTKIKAKFDSSLPHHKVMKINCGNQAYYLGFKSAVFNEWFLRLVWAKLIIQKREVGPFGNWKPEVTDRVYKKSQFLGEWQPRYVTVNRNSLRSSKDGGSASLQITDTKQIWTRFEQIKGGYYLVVKLWYGIIKEEFAIPIQDSLQWLHNILILLRLT